MSYCLTNCKNCNKTISHILLPFRAYINDKVLNNKDQSNNEDFFIKNKITNNCCRSQIVTTLIDPTMENELENSSYYKNYMNYSVKII
jgi:hypothetical protein